MFGTLSELCRTFRPSSVKTILFRPRPQLRWQSRLQPQSESQPRTKLPSRANCELALTEGGPWAYRHGFLCVPSGRVIDPHSIIESAEAHPVLPEHLAEQEIARGVYKARVRPVELSK